MAVSVLAVHFRDLRDLLSHLLNFLFFSSPIIYSLDGLDVPVATVAGTIVPDVAPLAGGPAVDGVERDPALPAVLLFTSGTAGPPKAAMLSAANLRFIQDLIIDHPDAKVDGDTINLCVLPLSHVYGLNISLLTTLRAGGTVVLQTRFHPADVVEAVQQYGVTHFAGVPPMWRALIDLEHAPSDAFDGVHRITTGASALPMELFHAFRDRFGVELSEGYGLTETASGATSHVGVPIHPGSVGVPFDGIEVVVVDHDDRPVPVDDSGLIKIRGANVFLGYWGDEEATKQVLDDEGWLRTGDVGVVSEEGYLHLVDRAKDLIIVSGFNVYPFEVEEVVSRHPKVGEAVVIGRVDEVRGERVVAYVTVNPGSDPPTLDEIVDFCRTELARYKCPKEIHVVDELPIAPTGKRIRRDLV